MANWVIPCNLEYYDIYGAFSHLSQVDWRQSATNIELGDVVYIYVGKPVQAIQFKCLVIKTGIPDNECDDSDAPYGRKEMKRTSLNRNMRLRLIKSYPHNVLTYDQFKAAGYRGNIQSQRHTGDIIQQFIDDID